MLEDEDGLPDEKVLGASYEVDVAGVRYPVTVSLRPLYDPNRERIKA